MSTNPPGNPPEGQPDQPGTGGDQGGYPSYPSYPTGDSDPTGGHPPQGNDHPSSGGYGSTPPSSGAGGYGGGGYGGGAPPQFSVGQAISYGWSTFKRNWTSWVGVALIFFVIQAVVQGIATGLGDRASYGASFGIGSIFFALVAQVASWLIQAAMTRGALEETEGRKPGIGQFFQWQNPTNVIVACLLVGVLTGIGLVLFLLPGIIFAFFAWYTLWFVIDDDQSPFTALQSSFSLVGKNFGPLLLLALACIGINIVGAILCLVGLLVTIPLTTIAAGFAFKYLTGKPIAAPTG